MIEESLGPLSWLRSSEREMEGMTDEVTVNVSPARGVSFDKGKVTTSDQGLSFARFAMSTNHGHSLQSSAPHVCDSILKV